MLGKQCKIDGCTNEQLSTSRFCESCYKKHKAAIAKKHYETQKHGTGICSVCHVSYVKTRCNQKFCASCWDKIKHATNSAISQNPYHRTSDHSTEHRNVARAACAISSEQDEVVHHVNLNPRDNSLNNLLVMTRSNHAAFHAHLKVELVKSDTKDMVKLTAYVLTKYNIPYKRLDI